MSADDTKQARRMSPGDLYYFKYDCNISIMTLCLHSVTGEDKIMSSIMI